MRSSVSLGLASWCLALLASEARALDSRRALAEYSRTSWNADQGLPQNTVQALAQTPDGYLWVATVEGLARFDGVRFAVFDRDNTPALSHNDIQTLLVTRDGSLWIGSYGGDLVRYSDGRFEPIRRAEAAPLPSVTALAEDEGGVLWIGTDGGGLYRLVAGRLQLAASDALPSLSVWCLEFGGDGTLWIGTSFGLASLRGGRLTRLGPRAPGEHERGVTALAEARSGMLSVGTTDGLYRLDTTGLVRDDREGLGRAAVRALATDDDGSRWVGTESGLYRLRDGRAERLSSREGLTDDAATALLRDREGSLWVGTLAGGINQLKDGPAANYTARQGLSSDNVESLASGRGGGLWIGTSRGELDRLHGGRFEQLSSGDLRGGVIRALHEDRRGRLWVGTDFGLRVFDGGWRSYTRAQGLPHDIVRSVLEDRRGRIWVGTDGGGIACLDHGRFTVYTARQGLAHDHVRGLLEARDGTLWIATYGGLTALRDGEFVSYTTRDGLASDLVRSLYEDADGILWIGTYGGGLSRLAHGRITSVTRRQGLGSDVIYAILEDDVGNLWMSGNRGVFSVSKRSFQEFADGLTASVISAAYGRSDGMISGDCNGGFPAGWKAPDGRLWFPTLKGLVAIDPAATSAQRRPPPATIDEAVVDGHPVAIRSGLDLGSGRRLELRFTALTLLAPERLRFAYQLEGFDRDWIDAGAMRAAHYTNVPPGRYLFRVRARLGDGRWSDEGTALPVRVKAPWYRTRSFGAACGAALVLGAVALHRLRLRGLVRRERELGRRIDDALSKIKVLSGLLPICASCKNIRDDTGYWRRIEIYIREHSEVEFTHALCPPCLEKIYPAQAERLRGSVAPAPSPRPQGEPLD